MDINKPTTAGEATGVTELQPQRWRDAPENQALLRQAIDTGAMSEAGETVDYHEQRGSDLSGVFHAAIHSKSLSGKWAPDTSKYPAPEMSGFEADMLDQLIGGQIKMKRIV